MRCQLDSLAAREGISINLFVCLAVAEKISRLEQPFLSNGTGSSGDDLRTSIRFESPGH
jgi:hypothetical protein